MAQGKAALKGSWTSPCPILGLGMACEGQQVLVLCAALVALALSAGAVAVPAVLLEQPCPVLFSAQV